MRSLPLKPSDIGDKAGASAAYLINSVFLRRLVDGRGVVVLNLNRCERCVSLYGPEAAALIKAYGEPNATWIGKSIKVTLLHKPTPAGLMITGTAPLSGNYLPPFELTPP